MALNVITGSLTSPALTGLQTITLASNFDPKAIICWTAGRGAAGVGRASIKSCVGFGTYRGGAAQHCYGAYFDLDAALTNDSAHGMINTALLKNYTAGTAAVDYICTLSQMTTGVVSSVILNWTDVPAAAIQVFYIIIGGTDITDAWCGTGSMPTSPEPGDIVFPPGASGVGIGHPDLIFTLHSMGTEATAGDYTGGGALCGMMLGVGRRGDGTLDVSTGVKSRCSMLTTTDAGATMLMAGWQTNALWQRTTTALGNDAQATLAAESLWPTDGFCFNVTTAPAASTRIATLMIKGNFTVELGAGTAPIAGGLPVVQSLSTTALTPKLEFIWGLNLPVSAAIVITNASLGQFCMGAFDGTNEITSSWMQLDGNTAALNTTDHSITKALRYYVPAAAATLQSECDGSFLGNDVRLSWNDIDTVAREYNWLVLREAAAGAALTRNVAANIGSAAFPTTGTINFGAGDL